MCCPHACPQVCSTLAQCGELFLQLPGVSATPLLVQALAADDSSSVDLLFDTGKEAEAWKVRGESIAGQTGPPVGTSTLLRHDAAVRCVARCVPASQAGSDVGNVKT